jgi:hypothetical protein
MIVIELEFVGLYYYKIRSVIELQFVGIHRLIQGRIKRTYGFLV